MKYRQISLEERYKIATYLELNLKISEIALRLGRSASTIYREISRNSKSMSRSSKYISDFAQLLTERRHQLKPKKINLTDQMRTVIEKHIRDDLSPEQITGRLRLEKQEVVSHETIYKHIYEDKRTGGELWMHLRRRHRCRRKRLNSNNRRGQIVDRVFIDHRPAGANNKTRYGHWEGDTIVGKNHKGIIISLTERKTRYQQMIKLKKKDAKKVSAAIAKKMAPIADLFQSITFDNGKEFAAFKDIEKALKCKVYFAHPYSAFERGLNENQNGLFRQYVPKSTDLNLITHKQIDTFTRKLNNRPRKGLGFKTPNELFNRKKVALIS